MARLPPGTAQFGDQRRIVPLMHDHQRRAINGRQRIEVPAIRERSQFREPHREVAERPSPLGQEIVTAPAILGLVCPDVVTAGRQLAQHAAKKMRVAVIPAGDERMREVDDPHPSAPHAAVAGAHSTEWCMASVRSTIASTV